MTKTKEVQSPQRINLSTTYKIHKKRDANEPRRCSLPSVLEKPQQTLLLPEEPLPSYTEELYFKDFHSNKCSPTEQVRSDTSEQKPLLNNGAQILRQMIEQAAVYNKANEDNSSSSLFFCPPVQKMPQIPAPAPVSPPFLTVPVVPILPKLRKTDFLVSDRLGNGAFGHVFLVQHKSTGLKCALKVMPKEPEKKKYQMSEKLLLSRVDSPFVVKFFGSFQGEKFLYLVTENIDGFSLEEVVKLRKAEKEDRTEEEEEIDEEFICAIFAQILRGTQILHQNNVAHRDLKPANILIDRANRCAKIIDLGYACETKVAQRDQEDESEDEEDDDVFTNEVDMLPTENQTQPSMLDLHRSIVGTPLYTPPETLLTGKSIGYSSEKMDVWALGIILFELLTGQVPFTAEDFPAFQKLLRCFQLWVNNTGYVKLHWPENRVISEEAKSLVETLLDPRVDRRPDLESVKRHPFFCNIDWATLDTSLLVFPPSLASLTKETFDRETWPLEDVVKEKECPPGFDHLSRTYYPDFDSFDMSRFGQEVFQHSRALICIPNQTSQSQNLLHYALQMKLNSNSLSQHQVPVVFA